jgi:hypothetical protein
MNYRRNNHGRQDGFSADVNFASGPPAALMSSRSRRLRVDGRPEPKQHRDFLMKFGRLPLALALIAAVFVSAPLSANEAKQAEKPAACCGAKSTAKCCEAKAESCCNEGKAKEKPAGSATKKKN